MYSYIMQNNSKFNIGIFTPIGVEKASQGNGKVTGRWKSETKKLTWDNWHEVAEDFANWPADPRAILRFTKKYAPLDSISGKNFHFKIEDWEAQQARFRNIWVAFGRIPARGLVQGVIEVESGEALIHSRGRLEYRAANLWRFLLLGLSAFPPERLKQCARDEGCPHPYFVAGHLGQKYCSTDCADWAQSNWKKAWWDARGETWRRKQKKQQKKARKSKGRRK